MTIILNGTTGITTPGPSVVEADSSDAALRITQTGSGNALVVEDEANPDSTPLVVDASGNLIVGNTSSVPGGPFNNNLNIQSYSDGGTAGFIAARFTDDALGGSMIIGKARGTMASPAIVQDDDDLAIIRFAGYDGTDFVSRGGEIRCAVDGTPGANDMPGRLEFFTGADNGGGGVTERMRITSDGYVRLSSNSLGIQFGGDTSADNALDDYEEGTFTPTLIGTTTAGTPTYIAQNGKYTKIGNVVIFNLLITLSNKGGMVGSLRIANLPFTDIADGINAAVSIGNMSGMSITAGQTVMGRVINNSASIALFLTDAASGNTSLLDTEIANAFSVDVAGSYFV